MSKEIKRLEKELYELGVNFLKAVKNKSPDQKGLWREYQEKRKGLIIKKVKNPNYHIAEDLRLIAEDFKEKYPSIASDVKKFSDVYLAEAKGENEHILNC